MIRLENVSKVFGTGVAGLSDISLFIDRGEFVFLVGHTGSGKTTLLRLLVRDMLPTEGTIIVSDFDIVKLPDNKIPGLRKKIGVVFQDLKLLMDRTILENIVLPMQVAGTRVEEGINRAGELLEMVGLSEHKEKYPVQLSGGELQRVAIARALALSPEILLADEPTGNLDPQTALEIVQLLEKINEMGTTIVMATHNLDIVHKLKKRVVGLDKGKLVKDEKHGSHKETKETKGEEKKVKGTEETGVKVEGPMISDQGSVEEPKKEEAQTDETKIEEHKKETRKLSDLLAKARATLRHHSEKAKDKKDDLPIQPEEMAKDAMPFGFEKDADVKETI